MGPIADVVNAIALGAVVGMKDTATRAVKDSYSGLKSIIQRKYRQVPLAQLEEQPKSEICKKMSEDALEAADALKDAELLRSAQALLDVLMRDAPEAAASIGVDIDQVKAARIRIAEVEAAGTGVRVRRSDIQGDIDISEVRAGVAKESNPKNV